MTRRKFFAIATAAIVAINLSGYSFVGTAEETADEPSAADLLPASIILYAEAPQPAAAIDLAYDHPLRAKVESIDDIKKALEGEQFRQVNAVIAMWEAHMGVDYRTALKALTAGGVSLAYDAHTQGAIFLSQADNDETATKSRDFLLGMIRADAAGKGNQNPFKTVEYRGATAYELEQGMLIVSGKWLAVTNKKDLGKGFVDRLAESKETPAEKQPTLAGLANYQAAKSASNSGATQSPTAWAFADLASLGNAGAAKELFAGKVADNFVGELLAGGILGALAESPYASASLFASTETVRVAFSMPYEASAIKPEREYFFGPEASGGAPALANVQNQLLSLSAYRDVAGMWLHAGDLFNENTNDQLALADSQLTTLFAGKDFGEEILGALDPRVQIVAARQDFTGAAVQPAIKLPAFAGVFTLKKPEVMSDELRRIFQSFVGFLNVVGAMEGQPQLDIDVERSEKLQVVASSYVASEDEKKRGEGRINFNFTPTAAFVGDKFILSSTEKLARELAASPSATQPAATPLNTAMQGDAQVLKAVLEDNRAQLVAQNMLEEGRTQEEADKAIGGLLSLVEAVRSANIEFKSVGGMLRLEAQADLATGAGETGK